MNIYFNKNKHIWTVRKVIDPIWESLPLVVNVTDPQVEHAHLAYQTDRLGLSGPRRVNWLCR